MTEDLNKQSVSFPAVSIITPTWNRKGLLAEAIESVRCQTATNWEHLIIDDGSSDGSREMVEALSAADSRIIWLPRDGEKDGANVCRNQGLRKSRGDYIVFLDSDDLLEPGCLERRVGLMRRNLDLDFAVFQTGFFVEKIGDRHQQEPGEIFGDDLLRILCFELPWIITAPIWRRETLKSLGGFDENLPSWQDIDLHLRAVAEDKKYLKFSVLDHHVRWHLEETRIGIQQRTSADHLMACEIRRCRAKWSRYGLVSPKSALRTILFCGGMLDRSGTIGGFVAMLASGEDPPTGAFLFTSPRSPSSSWFERRREPEGGRTIDPKMEGMDAIQG